MAVNDAFHEVFRYRRGDVVRVYKLRVVAGGTEFWRFTHAEGQAAVAVKEDDFNDVDAATRFFEEVERTLTAGGWRLLEP